MRWWALVGAALGLMPASAAPPDGTLELVDVPAVGSGPYPPDVHHLGNGTTVLHPIDSVSMTATQVWRENRHRAYQNPPAGIEDLSGYLLFDVSAIPDDALITEMKLVCHLEDAFGSPFRNPRVDIHYTPQDDWTRATVAAGHLSLGDRLVNDVSFPEYVPSCEFVLDPRAHDWTVDLADDRITLGFRDDVDHPSYVYFFGAGGTPEGPPPELWIRYQEPTAAAATAWAGLKAHYR